MAHVAATTIRARVNPRSRSHGTPARVPQPTAVTSSGSWRTDHWPATRRAEPFEPHPLSDIDAQTELGHIADPAAAFRTAEPARPATSTAFEPGETILETPCHHNVACIVVKGRVRAIERRADGSERLIAILEKDAVFGDHSELTYEGRVLFRAASYVRIRFVDLATPDVNVATLASLVNRVANQRDQPAQPRPRAAAPTRPVARLEKPATSLSRLLSTGAPFSDSGQAGAPSPCHSRPDSTS
jgi:hypothetical protein